MSQLGPCRDAEADRSVALAAPSRALPALGKMLAAERKQGTRAVLLDPAARGCGSPEGTAPRADDPASPQADLRHRGGVISLPM